VFSVSVSWRWIRHGEWLLKIYKGQCLKYSVPQDINVRYTDFHFLFVKFYSQFTSPTPKILYPKTSLFCKGNKHWPSEVTTKCAVSYAAPIRHFCRCAWIDYAFWAGKFTNVKLVGRHIAGKICWSPTDHGVILTCRWKQFTSRMISGSKGNARKCGNSIFCMNYQNWIVILYRHITVSHL